MPDDNSLLPPARLRAARAIALAIVLLMLLVILASAWLRLAQPRPACGDWPGCRSAHPLVLASTAPVLLGHASVLNIVRASHRLAASTVLLLVVALAALAWVRRPPVHALGRRALVMLGLTLALALLGVLTPGARSPAVLLGNQLGGFALLAVAWSVLCGLRDRPALSATLGRWAIAGALCWLVQAALGTLAGARLLNTAPQLHLALALFAGAWALVVGYAARRCGAANEGRALVALALLQWLLGAAAAWNAAMPALVLMHSTAAALGVALMFALGNAHAARS